MSLSTETTFPPYRRTIIYLPSPERHMRQESLVEPIIMHAECVFMFFILQPSMDLDQVIGNSAYKSWKHTPTESRRGLRKTKKLSIEEDALLRCTTKTTTAYIYINCLSFNKAAVLKYSNDDTHTVDSRLSYATVGRHY